MSLTEAGRLANARAVDRAADQVGESKVDPTYPSIAVAT